MMSCHVTCIPVWHFLTVGRNFWVSLFSRLNLPCQNVKKRPKRLHTEASRRKVDCLLTQNSRLVFSQLGIYKLLALLYAANSLSRSSAVKDELPAVWLKVSRTSRPSLNCFSGSWSGDADNVQKNNFGDLFISVTLFLSYVTDINNLLFLFQFVPCDCM